MTKQILHNCVYVFETCIKLVHKLKFIEIDFWNLEFFFISYKLLVSSVNSTY